MRLTTLESNLEDIRMSLMIEPATLENRMRQQINIYNSDSVLCASIDNTRTEKVEYYEGGENFSKVHSYALEYSRTPLIDRHTSDYEMDTLLFQLGELRKTATY